MGASNALASAGRAAAIHCSLGLLNWISGAATSRTKGHGHELMQLLQGVGLRSSLKISTSEVDTYIWGGCGLMAQLTGQAEAKAQLWLTAFKRHISAEGAGVTLPVN